jgi:TonB family protein
MKRGVAAIAAALLSVSTLVLAQSTAQGLSSQRKVTARIAPDYPELARRMRLQGVVKVEAVVRTNGTVKSTRVVGGNPVLVNAAASAVSKWRFEPGPSETTELIQLTFIPR